MARGRKKNSQGEGPGGNGRGKAPLGSLRPLIPFASVYRGRILAAFLSLLSASVATLVVPIALRRVIDHGFSPEGHSVIDAYFMALIGVGVGARPVECRPVLHRGDAG